MMLKIEKSKVKLGGAVILALLFCGVYMGMRFYSIPEKVNAVTWFPEEGSVPIPDTYTIKDIKYLQEMNKTVCDNSVSQNITDSVVLEDSRDGNKYTVQVLADDKCWMTQNLRITRESIQAKTSSNTNGTITSADSNVGTTAGTGNNYQIPASTTDGFDNTKTDGTHYSNQQVRASADNDYGAYYSYNVATVNTVATKDSGSANYDICPKGWRLPTGGSSGEFQALYSKYSTPTGFATVNSKNGYWIGGTAGDANNPAKNGGAFFPAAGDVTTSGLLNTGSSGYYWSSTIGYATYSYNLYFDSNYIAPAYNNNRYIGYSVRCVAKENVLTSEKIPETHTTSTSGSISVKVANTISIDAVSGTGDINVDSTAVANGTISATVAANTTYKVLLSAEETSLKPKTSTNTSEIPSLSSPNVVAGTNAWGIQKQDGTYEAMVAKGNDKEYYNTNPANTTEVSGTIHEYTVGISVSPSLPADTYSTDVMITAAAV